MTIELIKASLQDASKIHEMQVKAFLPLLEKYQDYDLSPATETVERIIRRIEQPFTHYYIIEIDSKAVGAIRIVLLEEGKKCRISPVFILPEYQNLGVAQKVFHKIETMYLPEKGWELETIKEELGNCYLYEKLGYKRLSHEQKVNDKMTLIHMEKGNK